MEQFTSNLERAHKYRFSHFQSFVSQHQKNKILQDYNVDVSKVWGGALIATVLNIMSIRKGNQLAHSRFSVITFLLCGLGFFQNIRLNENLQKYLNDINRKHPNPVQYQNEYARDLEILRRISHN